MCFNWGYYFMYGHHFLCLFRLFCIIYLSRFLCHCLCSTLLFSFPSSLFPSFFISIFLLDVFKLPGFLQSRTPLILALTIQSNQEKAQEKHKIQNIWIKICILDYNSISMKDLDCLSIYFSTNYTG